MTNPAFRKPAEIALIANREVRVVPSGWRHPKRASRYVPLLDNGMPAVAGLAPEQTRILAYETTTEGTPISPAFPNTPVGRLRLLRYCAENAMAWGRFTADAEAWAAILFGENAAVTTNGVVIAEDR